jgi:hypothetical protein
VISGAIGKDPPMRLVQSNEISEPKLVVALPKFVLQIFIVIWLSAIALAIFLPIESTAKYIIIFTLIVISLGVIKNHKNGNYLATMQANNEGLYFQTEHQNQYYYIPWKYIGSLEKTNFPLNHRGLRIEIIGEGSEILRTIDHVGNVIEENGRTYIYTIPQLRDRDKLIDDIENFRESA